MKDNNDEMEKELPVKAEKEKKPCLWGRNEKFLRRHPAV